MKNYLWVILLVALAAVLVVIGVMRKSSGTSGRRRITVIPKEYDLGLLGRRSARRPEGGRRRRR